MKVFGGRLLWSVAALSFVAVSSAGQSLPTRASGDLERLQGYWEGEGAGGKCSITITGNTLHYRAGMHWHETTFTLPAGTNPRQLHATIKNGWPTSPDSVGQVVFAIFKIEGETLTLETYDPSDGPPKGFASAMNRYVVKKVVAGGRAGAVKAPAPLR
jgi:hypothetical protein